MEPLSLEVLDGEVSEESKAWVIKGENGSFLIIPDNRFPGRRPIRFFMSEADASRVIREVTRAKPELAQQRLAPFEVFLRDSLRRIAKETHPERADSFVVHTPNEVYDFLKSTGPTTIN